MEGKKKKVSRRRPRTESGTPGSDDSCHSDLAKAAQSFGAVAREAYNNCKKGADADAELHNRRNRSGQ